MIIKDLTPLQFPCATPPQPDGELLEVAPGILWLRMPLPLSLNHINLYLIRDHAGWMMVDTGIGDVSTQLLWEHIINEKLEGKRITGIVCTHYHFDHAGLAGWLTERLRVPLYMSYGEYYTLRTMATLCEGELPWQHVEYFRRGGMPADKLDDILSVIHVANRLITPPPAAFRRLRHGHSLQIGERRWQLLLGEGHVAEHMLLYSPDDQILIAGDQLLPNITSNISVLPVEPDADLLTDWLASLDRLSALPENTLILPAHERPYRGLHTRIAQLRGHHAAQLDALRRVCTTPVTAYEASLQLFPHRRSKMDDMMALGECLAHLNHLCVRGEVKILVSDLGIAQYGLAECGGDAFNKM
ncbi:MAG: MBL fold metallo-hydrolase [Sterolibacterium sp.]|jgi:glyoxylase-like metal-dependent hydrolase (beta-lactamase superfamily II)|nr:MBL fold metallo-hydrolase [Sterolibacterium sp.]